MRSREASKPRSDVKDAVEVVPQALYFAALSKPSAVKALSSRGLVLCIDHELIYEPFAADFGPLNLACMYRFCQKINSFLREGAARNLPVWFVTSSHPHFKANAAVLIGTWQVLFRGTCAAEAYARLAALAPFAPFRDASCGPSCFDLTVADCLAGVQRAKEVGFIDWQLPDSAFDVRKYEFYEQFQNGDWNWVVPGKLLAFSGPVARRVECAGMVALACEDYWDTFRGEGVTVVVRLNNKQYDRQQFVNGGFKHRDMYFPDGTCPPDSILAQFLELAETEPGALAVHCKAGLGRTGSLISCFIMKHFGFTAEEVIAYIRMCRPGSILGPQQAYLKRMQPRMWAAGRIQRGQGRPADLQLSTSAQSAAFFSRAPPPPLRPAAALKPAPAAPAATAASAARSASVLDRPLSQFLTAPAAGLRGVVCKQAAPSSVWSNLATTSSRSALGHERFSTRATLHTDTLKHALRPKLQPDGRFALAISTPGPVSTSSAAAALAAASSMAQRRGSLRTAPPPASAPSGLYVINSRAAPAGALRTGSGVAVGGSASAAAALKETRRSTGPQVVRTVAPNGQPRKVVLPAGGAAEGRSLYRRE